MPASVKTVSYVAFIVNRVKSNKKIIFRSLLNRNQSIQVSLFFFHIHFLCSPLF